MLSEAFLPLTSSAYRDIERDEMARLPISIRFTTLCDPYRCDGARAIEPYDLYARSSSLLMRVCHRDALEMIGTAVVLVLGPARAADVNALAATPRTLVARIGPMTCYDGRRWVEKCGTSVGFGCWTKP